MPVTAVSHTPRAASKVDEAEFFLFHMRDVPQRAGAYTDHAQAFRYYMNAFLNAAYSCREVLRAEAVQGKLMSRRALRSWESEWARRLGEYDARLWNLGPRQRNREVHDQRGAETVPVFGLVAMTARRLWRGGILRTATSSKPTGLLLDDQSAAALAGLVPLQFATVLHFQDKGDQLEVLKVCARYFKLLREYVAEFNKSISVNGERR